MLSLGAIVVTVACSSRIPGSYLGRPGEVPHGNVRRTADSGVYTFESPLNFCRGTRWIISGTMASQWPDEPKPVLVGRATPIQVIDQRHVECGDLDDRLSMVTGDLVHYRDSHGQERYALASDVYSQQQYDDYAQQERAVNQSIGKRPIGKAPKPLVPLEWGVLKYGYEGALDKVTHENMNITVTHITTVCSFRAADYYLSLARAAFDAKKYDLARRLSWSAYEYVGQCHGGHAELESGDTLLVFSKAEIRLGLLTAGKNDADSAASDYVGCKDAEDLDQPTRDYCAAQQAVAHDLMLNG